MPKTVTSKRGVKYTERTKTFSGKQVTFWEPTGVTEKFYQRLQGEGARRAKKKKKGKAKAKAKAKKRK